MALKINKPDGCILTASSWAAYREFAPLHFRRPCPDCDGDGERIWLMAVDANQPSRWFTARCKRCDGRGSVAP